MTTWDCTKLWYQHWRKFVHLMRDPSSSPTDRYMYSRAAVLAQSEYVMSLAEEQANEARS